MTHHDANGKHPPELPQGITLDRFLQTAAEFHRVYQGGYDDESQAVRWAIVGQQALGALTIWKGMYDRVLAPNKPPVSQVETESVQQVPFGKAAKLILGSHPRNTAKQLTRFIQACLEVISDNLPGTNPLQQFRDPLNACLASQSIPEKLIETLAQFATLQKAFGRKQRAQHNSRKRWREQETTSA
jgi:hypothetical protein